MDQEWNKSEHNQSDVMEPFHRSGVAIMWRQRPPLGDFDDECFYDVVEQLGTNLKQVRTQGPKYAILSFCSKTKGGGLGEVKPMFKLSSYKFVKAL